MRELKSIHALIDSADLDTQRPFAPSEKSGEGIFIPTNVKYFAVTALLWIGLLAACGITAFGAVSAVGSFTAWTSR